MRIVNTCKDGYPQPDERFVDYLPALLKPQAEVIVKMLNEASTDSHRMFKAVEYDYQLK